MFGSNLAKLRKQKGMSQEILAQQLNVVRQTVSKWEKGLSVPDAQMLKKIAELFEVDVNVLLGSEIEDTKNENEIAVQLAVLNEQLANRTSANRKLIRNIIIGCMVGFILLLAIMAFLINGIVDSRIINLTCIVDGEVQTYAITTNRNNVVTKVEGNQEVLDSIDYADYSDPNELANEIVSYSQNTAKESLDYYCDDDKVEFHHDYHLDNRNQTTNEHHDESSSNEHHDEHGSGNHHNEH